MKIVALNSFPAVLALIFLFSCRQTGAPHDSPANPVAAFPVHVMEIAPRDLDIIIRGAGNLQSSHRVELYTPIDGVLELREAGESAVKVGDRVSAGQVLATVNNKQLSLNAGLAELTRGQAEVQLERIRRAAEGKLKSDEELKRAEFEFRAAQIRLEKAQLELTDARIASPLSGTLTAMADLVSGQFVRAGCMFAVIEDIDELLLKLAVPVEDTRQLDPGQKVIVSVEKWRVKEIEGTLDRIASTVDVKNRTVEAAVRIQNQQHLLLPGMFAEGAIVVDQLKDIIAAPRRAVRSEEKSSFVFGLLESSFGNAPRAIKREIVLGQGDDQFVHVTAGLKTGDKIVVSETRDIKTGTYLQVLETIE